MKWVPEVGDKVSLFIEFDNYNNFNAELTNEHGMLRNDIEEVTLSLETTELIMSDGYKIHVSTEHRNPATDPTLIVGNYLIPPTYITAVMPPKERA